MAKFPPASLSFLDYLQRGVTLTLFGITVAGAYTLGEGAYNIIGRRYGLVKPRSLDSNPPAVVNNPADAARK